MSGSEAFTRLIPHGRYSTSFWEDCLREYLPGALKGTDDTPEYVIRCIHNGSAGCFFMRKENTLRGFIVTNFINTAKGQTFLNIFVCCVFPGQDFLTLEEAEYDFTTRIIPQLEEVGGPVISAITFRSTREEGFTRRLKKMHYAPRLVEFIKWI